MKVGILTVHRLPNFGSVLQTYALYKTINSLGYDCEIIDYLYPNEWHIKKGCWHPKKGPLKRRIARYLGLRPKNYLQLMNEFVFSTMKMSKPYSTFDSIHKNPPIYDIYISGSDQLWNWKTMYMDTTFMLDFAPDSKSRISYSTSIAQNTIPEEYQEQYRQNLSKYKAISVREKNGQTLLKELFDINAEVVLDPTLLLDGEQWERLSDNARFKTTMPNRYILCYSLGYTFNPTEKMKELISRLEQIYNCPVIMLNQSIIDYSGNVFHFPKSQPIGIPEILWLIRHATVIATSSFHGTAFSANLGRPFYSLIEKDNQADDRISSFLHKIGVSSQIVTMNSNVQKIISCEYDTDKVKQSLNSFREQSLLFLRNNLS